METSRAAARPSMGEIQRRVTGVLVTQTGADPSTLRPETDLVRDLGIDSLDLVEIFMEVEQDLGVTLPEERQSADQFYKRAFTGPLTLRTLVELVHVRWGSGAPERRRIDPAPLVDLDRAGFAQRGWDAVDSGPEVPVYEHVGSNRSGLALHRRERDGMPCVLVPGGRATIGSSGDAAGDDERPPHTVRLSPYLLDLELVSITAYCRFLNSVDVADERTLRRWFLLEPGDRRQRHACVERNGADWRPRPGAAEWPMVLVSWHGARAYARWAHGLDPLDPDGPSHLPTEAQWEHAARGGGASDWPWGDAPPAPGRLRAGRAREAQRAGTLPLGPVHALDGEPPFELRGMLGHVWQWCADTYAPDVYAARETDAIDPVEERDTGLRAERGGSWVGPESLCRPSYRRGRAAGVRGRCLGFRCAAPAPEGIG